MKIVLDTNVFVSGIFWNGVPSDILDLWKNGKFLLCITPEIFHGYNRISNTLTKKYPGVNIDSFLSLVAEFGKIYQDISLPEPVSCDPDDDKFIACAISASANMVVSGDSDLLDVGRYKHVEMLSPKDFLLRL